STPIDSGPGGTGPDLVITKDDGGATVGAGGLVTYTLGVRNTGNQDATGVELTDAIPSHTSFVAASSDPAWACDASTCTLAVGALGAGDSAQSFTLAFMIDDPLAGGVSQISNSATATDDGVSGPDLNAADNTAVDSTPIDSGPGGTGPDLVITKDDGGATVGAGGLVTYTLGVRNTGNQDA
ncbi:MAG: DUF11 domain-containing protein, partial [Planctomycetes bacterium]|nr:DUF11 domain-containing protein [Planctomycetota bacterium]